MESTTEAPVAAADVPQATLDAPTASSQAPEEYAIVPATVVRLTDTAALCSFGWKSEGQVLLTEFEKVDGKPAVKVGDAFEVLVETLGEAPEQTLLSKEKAEKLRIWDTIAKCGKGGQIQGTVVAHLGGGYAVDIGMRAFLPSAQADLRRVSHPESLVGETLTFTLAEFDKRRGNIVVSRRALLEKELKAKKSETLAKLSEGAVLDGVVRSLTDFGAFVDLGGLDGLIHVTEMSWGRVGHPREVLKIGQEVKVKVLKYDAGTGKIGLGLKQLLEDPWTKVADRFPVGKKVRARVSHFADFGAFVTLAPAIDGLIHVSQLSWKHVKHPSSELQVGEEIEAIILDVDVAARRISLSLRQLQPNPWEKLHDTYPIGSTLRRKIRGLTDFGVFLGVEDGIDGLVHISELSWAGNVKHPSDLFKVGDEVDAKVLDIDGENQRLSLSIKALLPDPWQEMAGKHPVGSKFTGKVMRLADFGAFVQVEPGIEGLVHISELANERVETVASVVKVGDEIEVKVLDLNMRDHKVSLSVRALTEVVEEEYREHLNQEGAGKTKLGEVFGDKLKLK